jgi:hypothetical protein
MKSMHWVSNIRLPSSLVEIIEAGCRATRKGKVKYGGGAD